MHRSHLLIPLLGSLLVTSPAQATLRKCGGNQLSSAPHDANMVMLMIDGEITGELHGEITGEQPQQEAAPVSRANPLWPAAEDIGEPHHHLSRARLGIRPDR